MFLAPITELVIVDVMDRGIPNKECIAISVEETQLDIGQYGLLLGVSMQYEGMGTPIRDNFFWFGGGIVKNGDWLFVYTGSGTPTTTPTTDMKSSIYTLYWNRPQTLFHNSNIVPMLVKLDAIQVLPVKKALPQK